MGDVSAHAYAVGSAAGADATLFGDNTRRPHRHVQEILMPAFETIIEDVQVVLPRTSAGMAGALNAPGLIGRIVDYRLGDTIYLQGDPADTVLCVQHGSVVLSLTSSAGKEGIVGVLRDGDFFGEAALAGRPSRVNTASALTASRIRIIPKTEMLRLLYEPGAIADRFITHLLTRNRRLEEDLVDQLFNSSEKRLARTLLMLAGHERASGPLVSMDPIPQGVLAEMVGTTRSRVSFFMNRFRKLGFVDYNRDGLTVHHTLLNVLRDTPASAH
jgi:CRP-like cAMP-binding protein